MVDRLKGRGNWVAFAIPVIIAGSAIALAADADLRGQMQEFGGDAASSAARLIADARDKLAGARAPASDGASVTPRPESPAAPAASMAATAGATASEPSLLTATLAPGAPPQGAEPRLRPAQDSAPVLSGPQAIAALAETKPAGAPKNALAYAPLPDPLAPSGRASDAPASELPGLAIPLPRSAAPDTGKSGDDMRLAARNRADLVAMRAALQAYRQGDLAQGDAAAALIDDPAAKTMLEWLAIRFCAQQAGLARIEAFASAAPLWPAQTQLRRRAEEAFVASRPSLADIKVFFADRPAQTPSGKLALAEAAREDGRTNEALAMVRRIWMDEDLSLSGEQRLLQNFPDALTAADHRDRMERLLFKERWQEALRVAAMAGPDYVKLATARVAVGRGAANAAAQLDKVPPALRQDTSFIYAKALLARRKDKPIEAAQALTTLTRDPAALIDGDAWWVERRIIARKLLDIGEQRLAYAVAQGHGAETPAMQVEAEFHAGWIALRFLNAPALAGVHFAAAAEAALTPISIARASYWQGRAAEAAGESGVDFYRRAAEHATTYYGQLARARLGYSELALRLPPQAEPTPEKLETARALGFLYALDERDLALPLFAEIGQRASPADLTLYGDLALQKGDAKALLTLGKNALQRGQPLEVHAFPTIGLPAAPAPVERAMVYAIARQESAFDNRAISTAGARGLMQLMPATAKATAARAGMGYDADRLTADAGYNTTIGAAHLGDLVSEWRGSYILAFAAYNAGSGNVRKWMTAYGDPRQPGVDPVDWVERIPFTETRNYVQRVMENLQVYRGILTERSTLLIESDLKRGLRQ